MNMQTLTTLFAILRFGAEKHMSKFTEDFKKFLIENGENIYSVGEYTVGGKAEMTEVRPANACNNIYSVSKVFTVTAVGILCDRELLSTDESVSEILLDELPENYNKNWDKTTVDMLLRHRVGIPGGALDIDCLDASKFCSDYLKEVTTLPWDCEPGSVRRYTDGAFYILSRIVAKRAGMPMQNLLWKELFLPLGFKEVSWSTCPMGHAMGATGLYIRSDDMVKLGGLYLQKGIWNSRQIISENWVNTVLERSYELSQIGSTGAYSKGGMMGQELIIIPSEGRAVGYIGHRRGECADLHKFIFEYGKQNKK